MVGNARRPIPPAKRMAAYRNRMRSAGLKLVQVWVPDTQASGFARKCNQQARAIAKYDPAGAEALRFIQAAYEWPQE